MRMDPEKSSEDIVCMAAFSFHLTCTDRPRQISLHLRLALLSAEYISPVLISRIRFPQP